MSSYPRIFFLTRSQRSLSADRATVDVVVSSDRWGRLVVSIFSIGMFDLQHPCCYVIIVNLSSGRCPTTAFCGYRPVLVKDRASGQIRRERLGSGMQPCSTLEST
jgi:hypothetical protein